MPDRDRNKPQTVPPRAQTASTLRNRANNGRTLAQQNAEAAVQQRTIPSMWEPEASKPPEQRGLNTGTLLDPISREVINAGDTVRRAQQHLFPAQSRSEMMNMVEGSLTALGPAASTGGAVTRTLWGNAGRHAHNAGTAANNAQTARVGIVTPGQQGARQAGEVILNNRTIATRGQARNARAIGGNYTGTATTLATAGGTANALLRDDPRQQPSEAPTGSVTEEGAGGGGGETPPIQPGAGTPQQPRDLQSLLRRMEAGETLRQEDFDKAGYTGDTLDTVPAGASPFGGLPGSLRDLSMEDRGKIYAERDRRARFEGGDLSAARPGDLRRLRAAFGANSEEALASSLRGRDRMAELKRQDAMTPEQRAAEAGQLATARATDARTLREGFQGQREQATAEMNAATERMNAETSRINAETSRMSTILSNQPEDPTLDQLINSGLTPEAVDQLGETTIAELETAFGGKFSDEQRQRAMGLSQGYLKRATETAYQRFGGQPTAAQMAGHVQEYQDLFTSGMGLLMSAQNSADSNSGFLNRLRNAFQEGGGQRGRTNVGVLSPQDAQQTMQMIEGVAGALQAYNAGEDHPDIVRGGLRTAGRMKFHDELIIRDPATNEVIQTLDMREIPNEIRAKMLRGYQGN